MDKPTNRLKGVRVRVGERSLKMPKILTVGVAALALIACGDDPADGGSDTQIQVDSVEDTSASDDTAAPPDTTEPDTVEGCAEGTPCDDEDPCTSEDACDAAGLCVGVAVDCDDGLACTRDACAEGSCTHELVAGFCLTEGDAPTCANHNGADPANSCLLCDANSGETPAWIVLVDSAACDDGDACTSGEACMDGVCEGGEPVVCASDNSCRSASCDIDAGCVTTPVDGDCDDADPCTVGDACLEGECASGADMLDCDDGDACTEDACEPGVGCVHTPTTMCDDGDPCTNDTCQPGGTCTNEAFTGPCEDGDPCTSGEVCDAAGVCEGGSATDCSDDSVCTLDSCHPTLGCLNLHIDGGCDDGTACTTNDQCVAGACFGGKTNACDLCPVTQTDHANKITTLEVMGDGNPGSGLDVDGDPNTCAPSSGCGGGVDNALAPMAVLINPSINDSVNAGVVKWVVDLKDFDANAPFSFSLYDSSLTDASELAGCDFQTETCDYDVAQLSFDQNCEPYFEFDNAVVTGNQLVAGGVGKLISMVLPLEGGSLLPVTIANARVTATLILGADGKVTSMSAIIGGAIPKAQLVAAINGLSESALPIDKASALQLLDIAIVNDIDLDNDGIFEAASVGMRINTIPAVLLE